MKETILALCMLNPCVTIPNANIILVPLPAHILHPMINVDDQEMEYCDECKMHIKWVHAVRGA